MKAEIIELFKKKKGHEDLAGIYWVINSLSKHKHEKRNHVTHVKVENNCFIATDGIRLHLFKSESKFTDGKYRVIKHTKSHIFLVKAEQDFDYPETGKLMDTGKVEPFTVQRFDDSYNAYSKIVRKMGEGTLNYKILDDALMVDNDFDCYVEGHEHPIILISKDGKKQAVIMGLRV